ncbi:hypothetical protein [Kitasatospora sp. LaBMicrA B282]|uniref:hypothetical protein n=1 Tax=Kitasatospora sp. LaBMicrA B282 TaxID=3420949 RepID=UPI003D0BE915
MTKQRTALGLALVTAACLGPATAASAASAGTAPAHGSAHGPVRLAGFARLDPRTPTPDTSDRLTLAVDARTDRAADPASGRGHATIQHLFRNPDGSWQGTVRIDVSIDCLTTSGPTATVTGTVDSLTFTVPPGQQQPPRAAAGWHPETGFTFSLGGPEAGRIGWTGTPDYRDPSAPPVATRCRATPPTFYLVNGGFAVSR